MRWLLCVAMIILTTQATFAQPGSKSAIYPTVGNVARIDGNDVYDPTDYRAVVECLAQASKPSVVGRLLTPRRADSVKRFSLSRRFRAGYRRETGPLVAVTLVGDYHRGEVRFDGGASVKGWYCLRFSGRNTFNRGSTIVSYEALWESFPTYFYGLGYRAVRHNRRTTYHRISQSVGGVLAQRVSGQLWVDVALLCSRDMAHDLSPRALEYLGQADESLSSIVSTALSVALRYESRALSGSVRRGVKLRIMQQVRPKMLSDLNSTLWHTSLSFGGYCPLWRGAVMENDINCELFSRATPWLLWPSVGSDDRLRIYSYGRYIDRNMVAAHITLHQRIYGPVGCEVWGGAVNMFSARVVWRHTLPSYGVGARFISDDGLTIRIGYGFGRHTHGVVIGVNEKF